MANFYMMIGIPGSGKTTWAREFIKEQREYAQHHITYVCPDDIREQLTSDASNQSMNGAVWQLTYQLVEQNLQNNISILVDATFVKTNDRRKMLNHAKKYSPQDTYAYLCYPELSISKERNKNRNRVVPEFVLDRMYNQLNTKEIFKDGFSVVLSVEHFNQVK